MRQKGFHPADLCYWQGAMTRRTCKTAHHVPTDENELVKPKETSLRTRLLMLMSAFMLPTLAAAAVAIYYIGEQKQQQF